MNRIHSIRIKTEIKSNIYILRYIFLEIWYLNSIVRTAYHYLYTKNYKWGGKGKNKGQIIRGQRGKLEVTTRPCGIPKVNLGSRQGYTFRYRISFHIIHDSRIVVPVITNGSANFIKKYMITVSLEMERLLSWNIWTKCRSPHARWPTVGRLCYVHEFRDGRLTCLTQDNYQGYPFASCRCYYLIYKESGRWEENCDRGKDSGTDPFRIKLSKYWTKAL